MNTRCHFSHRPVIAAAVSAAAAAAHSFHCHLHMCSLHIVLLFCSTHFCSSTTLHRHTLLCFTLPYSFLLTLHSPFLLFRRVKFVRLQWTCGQPQQIMAYTGHQRLHRHKHQLLLRPQFLLRHLPRGMDLVPALSTPNNSSNSNTTTITATSCVGRICTATAET